MTLYEMVVEAINNAIVNGYQSTFKNEDGSYKPTDEIVMDLMEYDSELENQTVDDVTNAVERYKKSNRENS